MWEPRVSKDFSAPSLLRIMHHIPLLTVAVSPNLHFLLGVFHSVAPPYLSKLLFISQTPSSAPCMPSIILCPLILSTLQDLWQSLPHSPGILAHSHLTGTHQSLHRVLWPCTHVSNKRISRLDETLQSIGSKHLEAAQIPSTTHLTNGFWGPTIGMRAGMSNILHKWELSTSVPRHKATYSILDQQLHVWGKVFFKLN